jgi:hypothetical protein
MNSREITVSGLLGAPSAKFNLDVKKVFEAYASKTKIEKLKTLPR